MSDDPEYMRVYMLERYHRRRKVGLELLGGKCADCDAEDDLEFDHIDRTEKSFDIGRLWSCSEERFWREVAKCTLRCTPHHRARTAAQFAVGHGEGKSGKKNCKCQPCRARKAEYMRAYHLRRIKVRTA